MSKLYLAATFLPLTAICQPLTIVVKPTSIAVATRTPAAISSPLTPVNTITRREIEQLQAQTVVDVVKTLPGVEVINSGGRGQLSSLRVRGGTAAQTLILIDGVRSASLASGVTELNNIPLNQIERIDYIRGPQASVYGSDAINGLINIITRPAMGTDRQQVSVGAGSKQHRQAALSITTPMTPMSQLKVAGAAERQSGYNVHPLLGVNDGDRHGYRGQSAMLDYQLIVNDKWDLATGLRWSRHVAQYDQSALASPWGPATQQRHETWVDSQSYQVAAHYQDECYVSELKFFLNQQDAYDYPDHSHRRSADNRTYTRQYGMSWVNNIQLGQYWRVAAGTDWQRDLLLDSSFALGQRYPQSEKVRDNMGVYGVTQFDNGPWQIELSTRSDDNDQFGRHTTWQSAAGWRFMTDHHLIGRYGSGFRAPSFNDLYYPNSGNPHLKPETSTSYEVMLDGKMVDIEWRLSGYRNDVNQMIQWAPTSQGWMPQNIGRARIEGTELEAQLTTGWLTHRASIEYKKPMDRMTDKQLQLVSRQGGKWLTQANWQQVDLSLGWIYQGDRYSDATNTARLGGYSLWNLALGYHVTSALKVAGKINNLLDKQYQTAEGYPASERAFYMTVDYFF